MKPWVPALALTRLAGMTKCALKGAAEPSRDATLRVTLEHALGFRLILWPWVPALGLTPSAGMTKVRVVIPEFRASEISGTQGCGVGAEIGALGTGSRASRSAGMTTWLVTNDP